MNEPPYLTGVYFLEWLYESFVPKRGDTLDELGSNVESVVVTCSYKLTSIAL